MDKHSRLLRSFVYYDRKKFYKTGPGYTKNVEPFPLVVVDGVAASFRCLIPFVDAIKHFYCSSLAVAAISWGVYPEKLLQTSLIFACEDLPLLAQSQQVGISLSGTNTLAYFASTSVMEEKSIRCYKTFIITGAE